MYKKHVNWGIVNYWKPQMPEDYAADLLGILYHYGQCRGTLQHNLSLRQTEQ
jgi:hypothetical protein